MQVSCAGLFLSVQVFSYTVQRGQGVIVTKPVEVTEFFNVGFHTADRYVLTWSQDKQSAFLFQYFQFITLGIVGCRRIIQLFGKSLMIDIYAMSRLSVADFFSEAVFTGLDDNYLFIALIKSLLIRNLAAGSAIETVDAVNIDHR